MSAPSPDPGPRRLRPQLRSDRGSSVAEFPLVVVLVIVIAYAIVQAALIMHTRNTLIDAAVQGAHHASLVGSTPADGAARAQYLVEGRFGSALASEATAELRDDGTIVVRLEATLPVLGLLGPAQALSVEGRALDEADR